MSSHPIGNSSFYLRTIVFDNFREKKDREVDAWTNENSLLHSSVPLLPRFLSYGKKEEVRECLLLHPRNRLFLLVAFNSRIDLRIMSGRGERERISIRTCHVLC